MRAMLFGCAGALALACSLSPRVLGDFTFTKIADSAGVFSNFGPSPSAPSINSSGTVAFLAGLDAGGEGVFTGSGGPTTTIATADFFGPLPLLGIPTLHPPVNASGVVAFKGALDTGVTAIYVGSGGLLDTIADSTAVMFDDFGTSPAINDAGLVAFNAISAGVDGIFAGTTTMATTIADSGPFSTFLDAGFGTAVSINELGTVAFKGLISPGPIQGVYKGAGFAVTPIADASLPEVAPAIPLNGPDINDAGTVVFRSALDAGGEGIFTGTGGALTTVATTDGPYSSFEPSGLYPGINASGLVAFRASLDGGGQGIFTGPDAVADKVVKAGDALDGSTVTDLRFSRFGLNDDGQIAFFAMLSDGRSGIFVATPEPLLPGDYNDNNVVDAADYVVWRDREGTSGPLPNDPIGGMIDADQYEQWKTNFGKTGAGGSSAYLSLAPEPAAWMLLVLGVIASCAFRSFYPRPRQRSRS